MHTYAPSRLESESNAEKPNDVFTLPNNFDLTAARFQADPLADDAIAALLVGAGAPMNEATSSMASDSQWDMQIEVLNKVTAVMASWRTNADIMAWRAEDVLRFGLPLSAGEAIAAYTAASRTMPDWADSDKMKIAEKNFVAAGVLPVTLLFCASLPQCYVLPDLSAVLQATGQLDNHTDHRIRASGAMIFPVMMPGGLTSPEGAGIAQILKVRLIHATIRHLILQKSPTMALAAHASALAMNAMHTIMPTLLPAHANTMYGALLSRGWNITQLGLPCNQEELAYTLLTFSYVYLEALRTLGVPQLPAEEDAYLHTWNVAGHFLGIERTLMVDEMHEAGRLFQDMQVRGRALQSATPVLPDPRPALGCALIGAMSSVIPVDILKPMPELLTRKLCGKTVSHELGLTKPLPILSTILFMLVLTFVRIVDGIARLLLPRFSISRLLTRVIGYQFITKLLMSQTRPLRLPDNVQTQMQSVLSDWGNDTAAPAWINYLEDCMTQQGGWHQSSPQQSPQPSKPA